MHVGHMASHVSNTWLACMYKWDVLRRRGGEERKRERRKEKKNEEERKGRKGKERGKGRSVAQ